MWVTEILYGLVSSWMCVMLCKDDNNFGALPLKVAEAWALGKNIPFLTGLDIIKAPQGGARS